MGAIGWQEAVALAIVLAAAAWLVRRQFARRRKKSCGCEGCPGAEKLAENVRAAQSLRKLPPARR